jgi:N-methylhydantoinase B
MTTQGALAGVYRQILWNRLIAVVEEQARALMRTAFSTSVREAGDLSAGVFDRRGRMVAQAVTGTPGHVNSMANAVPHFLARHPLGSMAPGDHFITNDPWIASGHLHDITVVSPTFHRGGAVALFACTIHVVDIGGRGFGPDGRQIYEEGLYLPILPLARAGAVNGDLLELVRCNVREPEQVVGDMIACCTSNDEGSRRLTAMLDEYGLSDIEDLADYVIGASRAAMVERIRRLPTGTYQASLRMDGYERPVDIVAALTVAPDGITVDYDGTSEASRYGINVVMNYTQAYTCFGVNCIIGGDIPNNHGSLEPVRVKAPAGCIVNALPPAPVAMRHIIGHLLPDVVFGCLDQATSGLVPAQGSACLWNPQFRGGWFAVDPSAAPGSRTDQPSFNVLSFHAGGTGARPTKDGLSATAFPSGVRTIAVEVTESIAPVVFWRKELRPDSGGAGRTRGGLGQRLEIGTVDGSAFSILLTADKVDNPPLGLNGGRAGGASRVALASGRGLRPKGQQTVPAGDHAVLEIAGGGGYGDPLERDPAKVLADVEAGLVSRRAARAIYGVVLSRGRLDAAATARLRARLAAADAPQAI